MPEPNAPVSTPMMTDDQRLFRERRWPRLFAAFLLNFACFFVGSFIVECLANLSKYDLAVSLSLRMLAVSLAKALGSGLFFGLLMGVPTWLAQEYYGPKKFR